MKRLYITFLAAILCSAAHAQLNLQVHYDLGKDIHGDELSGRPKLTATVENFTADRWGSTFFFIDLDIADNEMRSAYAEIARELKFWEAPLAVHVEYNGGLSNFGSYKDAYLAGAAYNWANNDFSRTFSLQGLYKYLAGRDGGMKHSWQLTAVWGIKFAEGLWNFSGFVDVWHDNDVNGALIVLSEPQLWFNFNALDCVPDDVRLSIGTEVEISNNFVWPTDGRNNRFYTIPTLAAKWTF